MSASLFPQLPGANSQTQSPGFGMSREMIASPIFDTRMRWFQAAIVPGSYALITPQASGDVNQIRKASQTLLPS